MLRQLDMNCLRPNLFSNIMLDNGIHLVCLVIWVLAGVGSRHGTGNGARLRALHVMEVPPGPRASVAGMWGLSKVWWFNSKLIYDMLVRSMYPASSSTNIHQVLRTRDINKSEFIGRM